MIHLPGLEIDYVLPHGEMLFGWRQFSIRSGNAYSDNGDLYLAVPRGPGCGSYIATRDGVVVSRIDFLDGLCVQTYERYGARSNFYRCIDGRTYYLCTDGKVPTYCSVETAAMRANWDYPESEVEYSMGGLMDAVSLATVSFTGDTLRITMSDNFYGMIRDFHPDRPERSRAQWTMLHAEVVGGRYKVRMYPIPE